MWRPQQQRLEAAGNIPGALTAAFSSRRPWGSSARLLNSAWLSPGALGRGGRSLMQGRWVLGIGLLLPGSQTLLAAAPISASGFVVQTGWDGSGMAHERKNIHLRRK